MAVNPTSLHAIEHLGNVYHFCCAGCRSKFSANPSACLEPVHAPRKPRSVIVERVAVGNFSCPMHPEIITAAAGDCPLCGMSLEPCYLRATRRQAQKRSAISRATSGPASPSLDWNGRDLRDVCADPALAGLRARAAGDWLGR